MGISWLKHVIILYINLAQATSREGDAQQWSAPALVDDLPPAPELTPVAASRLLKLAREVKRLAALMTTGRDLHDIHTLLHWIAQWPQLPETTQRYAAHRLKLSRRPKVGQPQSTSIRKEQTNFWTEHQNSGWGSSRRPDRPRLGVGLLHGEGEAGNRQDCSCLISRVIINGHHNSVAQDHHPAQMTTRTSEVARFLN
jgi:hypothetical protein